MVHASSRAVHDGRLGHDAKVFGAGAAQRAVQPSRHDLVNRLGVVAGARRALAFQKVGELPEATWPDGPVPQQLHLDATVPTVADLDVWHERALALGARLIEDRSADQEEPLRVYADPAGHPFCLIAMSAGV
jgi:hypothetical protein